jgi:predicted MFS family arabinose efflux permease
MEIVEEHERPLMSSMRAMINNLTRALGIFIGGYLMTHFSYNTPYIFTIIFYLLGTYLFYYIFRDKIKNNQFNS